MKEITEIKPKTIHVSKHGIRALGIAESFKRELIPKKSILAGVIMRGDFLIDGFGFTFVTLGGMDATEKIIKLVKQINRPDISFLMLSGTVIALYNVVDLHSVYEAVRLPIIAISYEESEGIDRYLLERPRGEERLRIHRRNGPRLRLKLKNGLDIYVRPIGVDADLALRVLNKFTIHGRYPEPIRVAKTLSRSILFYLSSASNEIIEVLSEVARYNVRKDH